MAVKTKVPKKPSAATTANTRKPLLAIPQSKSAAAQAAKITLRADDSWSKPYWTAGDLHCRERELFG